MSKTITWPFSKAYMEGKANLEETFPAEPTLLDFAEYHEALAKLARKHGVAAEFIKRQLEAAGDYRKLAEERGE